MHSSTSMDVCCACVPTAGAGACHSDSLRRECWWDQERLCCCNDILVTATALPSASTRLAAVSVVVSIVVRCHYMQDHGRSCPAVAWPAAAQPGQ